MTAMNNSKPKIKNEKRKILLRELNTSLNAKDILNKETFPHSAIIFVSFFTSSFPQSIKLSWKRRKKRFVSICHSILHFEWKIWQSREKRTKMAAEFTVRNFIVKLRLNNRQHFVRHIDRKSYGCRSFCSTDLWPFSTGMVIMKP